MFDEDAVSRKYNIVSEYDFENEPVVLTEEFVNGLQLQSKWEDQEHYFGCGLALL